MLLRAGFRSVVDAVAQHTVFLDPAVVKQSENQALFPTIRDFAGRGKFDFLPNGRAVMLDDNSSPTDAFLWAAGVAKGRDVQFNHVWTTSRDPDAYTALWNVCATPAFLAKTTDGSNHPEVGAALRFRAYTLFGVHPAAFPKPEEPAGYTALRWAPHPKAIRSLEAELRERLAANPKSRTAAACREIGWRFSNWQPDRTI
jgi:hypothetical protein